MAEKLLFAPITKVDKEKREVWGYATLEVPDKTTPVPDVMDYDSAVAAFGQWPGNVREMHLPIAVGKGLAVTPDPEKRGIYIGARISESRDGQDAWTKIQEGVLTSFSIGAKGITRTPTVVKVDGKEVAVNRLKAQSIVEVSLVDNPACPGTQFSVAKAEEPTEDRRPTTDDRRRATVDGQPSAVTPDGTKRDMDPNVGGGVDRSRIPASDFVDPARRRFPIVTAGDVSDAVSSYGRAKPPIPYETFRRRLTSIAKRKGFESALPAEWKGGKAETAEGAMETLYHLAEQATWSDEAAKFFGDLAATLEALPAQIADEGKAASVTAGVLDSLKDVLGGFANRAEVAKLSEAVTGILAEVAALKAAVETLGKAEYATKPEVEGLKALSADHAGKVDVAKVSEDLAKALIVIEVAKGDLADLRKRVEIVERTPLPAKVALRTDQLDAKGLHQAEKAVIPPALQAVQQELADLEKRIDMTKDPRERERLGDQAGQLRIRLNLL